MSEEQIENIIASLKTHSEWLLEQSKGKSSSAELQLATCATILSGIGLALAQRNGDLKSPFQ